MHNYGDANKATFPVGAKGINNLTWNHFILPFIEQQAKYAQLSFDSPGGATYQSKATTGALVHNNSGGRQKLDRGISYNQ